MGLKKNYKLFNLSIFSIFILLLPLLIFASQEASASSGDIHTYAGLGAAGFSGDGGQATAALLNSPSCVAVDAAGNLYISDRANQRIRKVDTAGKISTIAGVGGAGYSGDGGSAVLAKLRNPSGIAVDSAGNVFFADMGNNRIRKISASGMITTVAGTGAGRFSGDGGPAVSAAIKHAEGVAVDSKGDIYISDTGNNRIRMIGASGIIQTVAGTGAAGFSGDGGPAISAKLHSPVGVALDSSGKLYVADCYNNRIRVIDTSGNITTLAGNGTAGFSGDGGPAASASLKFPSGVSVSAGNVYIADWHNQRVRVVNTSGMMTTATLAGTGVMGFSGDGAAAGSAILKYPFGLTTDSKGNIFIADSKNNRIRMVEGSYALPVSTITSPASYSKTLSGSSGLAVTGTASAANGVSYVEVSTDGGSTWNTASGTTTWNYKWTPQANGTYLIMSRATDSGGAHESVISCSLVKSAVRLAPPGSKIANPKNGATLKASAVVVKGVAAGNHCGLAKVEVSTDGGTTWNTAKGTANWSYRWTPQDGSYTIKTRATDKAGNVETPGTGVNVAVSLSATTGGTSKTPTPAPSPTSKGNAYYISPSGSDSGSGTISSPWKTINYASAKLKPGYTLYARGGTYTGQGGYVWHSSGTSSAPVTFKAYPGETPIFDGGWSIGECLTFSNNSWVVVDGISAQHFADSYGDGTIHFMAGSSNITVQNCWIHDNGTTQQDHDFYVNSGTANITIRDNLIQNAPGAGIQCWHGPNVNGLYIYNNVITGCNWGVVAGDAAQNISIYNNTIDHDQYGLDFSYAGQDDLVGVINLKMKNNIISNCGYGLRAGTFDYTQITGDYNLWYGNSTDVQWKGSNYSLTQYKANTSNEAHSIQANPSFAGSSNYHLNAGSPAIGAGTPLTLFKTNIAGATRSSWNMGAY
jgi:sugar lactone lactonase YvrE